MAICITPNSLRIGPYTLCEIPTGIYFNGRIEAFNFLNASPLWGTTAGFGTGGGPCAPAGFPAGYPCIDKFPFATGTSSGNVGCLSAARGSFGAQSSATSGYTTSGYNWVSGWFAGNNKFPFATTSFTASCIGSISQTRYGTTGTSSPSHGYASGGLAPPQSTSNYIDRFPFATDSCSCCVASLLAGRDTTGGASSVTHGYMMGGRCVVPTQTYTSLIDKFPFQSNSTSTTVGYLTSARGSDLSGLSSQSHGYALGGALPAAVTCIEKFPFAADNSAVRTGDLVAFCTTAGVSGLDAGYAAGGVASGNGLTQIRRISFVTDTNSDCVGNLQRASSSHAGHQD